MQDIDERRLLDQLRTTEQKRDAALPGSAQWAMANIEAKALRQLYFDASRQEQDPGVEEPIEEAS